EDGDAGRYIPDVFYRFKNEYGIEVKQSAKPCFPVEYLLVTLTHGFPTSPSPVFLSHSFPVENRPGIDRQAISQVISALSELKAPEIQPGQTGDKAKEVVKYLSDWHLLAFIGTMGVLGNNDVKVVAKTVASPNLADPHVLDPILNTEGWGTLMAIVQESAPARSSRAPPAPSAAPPSSDEIPPELLNDMGGGGGGKVCPHCTFENPPGGVDCEVCGLPLSG
ncbi:nuclear protein localization protein 4, partial [Tulasnella sp. 403]